MKKLAIRVNLESYLYLQNLSKLQRLGEELTNRQIEKLTNKYKYLYPNGVVLTSGDLGGKENNKWTSWSSEDMKKLLDEAKLTYTDDEIEEINVKFL